MICEVYTLFLAWMGETEGQWGVVAIEWHLVLDTAGV